MKKINLAIIFYGRADQKEINLQQYNDLSQNLIDFNISKYDFNEKENSLLIHDYKQGKIDFVLKNSYGRGNENDIELFLETNGIPYFGSDSKTTPLATSKNLSKNIFRKHGLPVLPDVFIDKS